MLQLINNMIKKKKHLAILLIVLGSGILGLIVYAIFQLPKPAPGVGRKAEKDGMEQVYINAGPFIMGASEETMLAECRKYRQDCLPGYYQKNEPVHTVSLPAFWMDRTEISNAMYALCVKAGSCRQTEDNLFLGSSGYYSGPEFDQYPVRNVTFEDAKNYCSWAGRRLPSEAEWEKAARGQDGRLYPWGNDLVKNNQDNFCDKTCPRSYKNNGLDDGYPDVAPVGSFPAGASPYGVLNMAGNLREWTSSLYIPYPYRPDDGRENLSASGNRVVRGGHWDGTADYGLSAYRFEDPSEYHSTCVGIRCASTP